MVRIKSRPIPAVTLRNGIDMPMLGLGTWKLKGSRAVDAVSAALELGYRHIDTASMYGNEEEIGKAIRSSNVPRDDIFITTKIWSDEKDDPEGALHASLQRLDMDYVDLYLIHWPSGDDLATWRGFEDLYDNGFCRAIGVSNFDYHLLKSTIVANCKIRPMVNQLEMHPGNCDVQMLRYAEKEHIAVTAYSPLAKGTNLEDATLKRIARAHDKTPAQVMLRWGIEYGATVIPKAARKVHQEENMNIFDFELSHDETRTLDSL